MSVWNGIAFPSLADGKADLFANFDSAGCVATLAQQIGNPTTQQGVTPPRATYAIRNARIVTVIGADIENGTVVIRDGKIEAVGANVSVPSGAQTIDGRGLSVYPGMIDAGTQMGLVEVGQGAPGTVDTAEVGDLNPNAKAIIAINPHSAHIAVTRVDGVTSALSLPSGGLISGQSALLNLVGNYANGNGGDPYAALVINYPRTSSGGGGGFFAPTANQSHRSTGNCKSPGRTDSQRCCATLKPTDALRMLMQKTEACRARIRISFSKHSFLMFAVSGQ